MPNGQMEPPEAVKVDVKKELEQARIRLHNNKFHIQLQEASIKRLEELSR
jgi:hypothetical protein